MSRYGSYSLERSPEKCLTTVLLLDPRVQSKTVAPVATGTTTKAQRKRRDYFKAKQDNRKCFSNVSLNKIERTFEVTGNLFLHGDGTKRLCITTETRRFSVVCNYDMELQTTYRLRIVLHKSEKRVEVIVLPPSKEQNLPPLERKKTEMNDGAESNKQLEACPKPFVNTKDIQLTVIVNLLLNENLTLNLRDLYQKMSKPYKENINLPSFKETVVKFESVGTERDNPSSRQFSGTVTLKKCQGLEYLLMSSANVSTIKKKLFSRIPISSNPLINLSPDKKTLHISNLRANILKEKAVFLKFTDNTSLKVETNHLSLSLEKGLNQNISLHFNMKDIYKRGDCEVRMVSPQRDADTTGRFHSKEEFVWNEDLVEEFAANPFLSSPDEDIINLPDSEDEEPEDNSDKDARETDPRYTSNARA